MPVSVPEVPSEQSPSETSDRPEIAVEVPVEEQQPEGNVSGESRIADEVVKAVDLSPLEVTASKPVANESPVDGFPTPGSTEVRVDANFQRPDENKAKVDGVARPSDPPLPAPSDLLSFDPALLDLAISPAEHTESSATSNAHTPAPVLRLDEAPADDSQPKSEPSDATAAIRRGPTSAEVFSASSLDQRLALPIGSIKLARIPLCDFLDVISEMTATPITLSPETLQLGRLAAYEPLDVDARETTAGELLEKVLSGRRLTTIDRGGQLIVVKAGADRRRAVKCPIDDLANGELETTDLTQLVTSLVEPNSWKSHGGTGTLEIQGGVLHIDNTVRVNYLTLIFLERLRLSRGLPTRSPYPVERLAVASTYAQLDDQLSQSATFTFLPWTRLADVFHHVADASGLVVLIDWSELSDLTLRPSTPVAASVIERPWDEALDSMLDPLALTWRAVDGRTIQITTRMAADETRTIEFYPLAGEPQQGISDSSAWIQSLGNIVAEQLGTEISDRCRFHFDEPGANMLVLASAPAHRVITAEWTAMRSEK
jgi:hypothetical protein